MYGTFLYSYLAAAPVGLSAHTHHYRGRYRPYKALIAMLGSERHSSLNNPRSDAARTLNEKDLRPRWQLQALSFTAFASTNICLNYYNAWALHPGHWPEFTFPILYTSAHMAAGFFASLCMLGMSTKLSEGVPSMRQLWPHRYSLLILSCCNTLAIGCNNMSLTRVSLFVNQVVKACSPMLTALFSCAIARKRYSIRVILSVCGITMGSFLSVVGSMHRKSPYGSGGREDEGGVDSDSKSSLLGLLMVFVSLIATALKVVMMMVTMSGTPERPKLPPTVVLLCDTFLSFWMMLVFWLVLDERDASVAYLSDSHRRSTGVLVVGTGSAMAVVLLFAVYYNTALTSALSQVVGANFVKICLILGSAVQAGVTSPLSWLGITISISSISSYAYFSFTEKQNAQVPGFAPLPSASADGNDASDVKSLSLRSSSIEMPTPAATRRPDESTPLNAAVSSKV